MRINYSTKIEKEYYDMIHELSDRTKIPQSKLMDEAIKDLSKKYEIKFPIRKEFPTFK